MVKSDGVPIFRSNMVGIGLNAYVMVPCHPFISAASCTVNSCNNQLALNFLSTLMVSFVFSGPLVGFS